MAIRTIEVPYRDGYDIGVGADLATGSPMGLAVDGVAEGVHGAGGATVSFEVRRIETTEELNESLGIDAEASYGSGLFGAGVSARFGFSKRCAVQTTSLFLTVTARVTLEHLSIRAPRLTVAAGQQVDNAEVFAQRYGNMFVRGLDRGGLFIGVFRLDVHREEDRTAISADLEGSYGLFSAEVSVKFEQVRSRYRCDALVSMYHEGGPIDLQLTDPTKPDQLLANANRWVSSFRENPDRNAVPYSVTLAPMAIAEGPLPPNEVQLRHAQDVLMLCARERASILDRINLLQFVVGHADAYDWTGDPAPTREALTAAVSGLELDLDLVADCAAVAMDDPVNAATPAKYAAGLGQIYPAGTVPAVMPKPKPLTVVPAGTIRVPDLVGFTRADLLRARFFLSRIIANEGRQIEERDLVACLADPGGLGTDTPADLPYSRAADMDVMRFLLAELSGPSRGGVRFVQPAFVGGHIRSRITATTPQAGTTMAPGTDLAITYELDPREDSGFRL